jgi:hypothetical protein
MARRSALIADQRSKEGPMTRSSPTVLGLLAVREILAARRPAEPLGPAPAIAN